MQSVMQVGIHTTEVPSADPPFGNMRDVNDEPVPPAQGNA